MKSLTFQLALIEAILTQTAEFSIHDITKTIRKNLTDQKYDLIDIDDRMDYLDFEVPVVSHDDVKRTFDIVVDSGIFELLGYEQKSHSAFRLFGKIETTNEPPKLTKYISLGEKDDEDIQLQNRVALGAAKGVLGIKDDGQFQASPELVKKIRDTVNKWLDNDEEVTLRRICNSIQVKGLGIYELRCLLEDPLKFDVDILEPYYKSVVSRAPSTYSW